MDENQKSESNDLDLVLAQIEQLDTDVENLKSDVSEVGEDVGTLVAASDSASASAVDYSEQLAQLGQCLVVTNVLLLVLMVVVFLNSGMTLGNAVVRWFKHDA